MQISQTKNGAVVILKLDGNLDSTTGSDLQAALLPAVAESGTRVAVDCNGIHYVSSAGLRVVLMAAKQAQTSGSKIALFGLSNPVRETFEISGFSRLVTIVATEPDAVATLNA